MIKGSHFIILLALSYFSTARANQIVIPEYQFTIMDSRGSPAHVPVSIKVEICEWFQHSCKNREISGDNDIRLWYPGSTAPKSLETPLRIELQ